MATAVEKLEQAIRDFHAEVGGSPRYRHVSANLRDAERELSRLPVDRTEASRTDESDKDKTERPKNLRDAKERARERLADTGEDDKDDRASSADEPKGDDGDSGAQEDS